MQSGRVAAACGVCAGLLLVLSLVLFFDNPTVDVSASDYDNGGSPAGAVGCSIAPWDAGLNKNDDGPGGEHTRSFFDEVAHDCYAANKIRYDAALASGVLALALLGAAVVVTARRHS